MAQALTLDDLFSAPPQTASAITVAQALTLDDLFSAPPQTAPAAPRPIAQRAAAPAAAPAKPLSLDDLFVAAKPAPPDDPDQHGFWHSFYDEAIAPLADEVVDTVKRGDVGAGTAGKILSGFYDQLKTFAGHPDIRNLPIIGTGATATAARMQRQFDQGNYAGMLGSAVGFVAPFAGPEAAAAAYDKLPAAGKAAAAATDATSRFAEAAGAGVKAAAPDLAAGAGKAASAAVISHFLPGGEIVRTVLGYEGIKPGLKQAAGGLKAGAQAYADTRAAQTADAATAARQAARDAAGPRVPIWQAGQDALDAQRAADRAATPATPMWSDPTREAREPAAGGAPEPAAAPQALTLDDLGFAKSEAAAAPAPEEIPYEGYGSSGEYQAAIKAANDRASRGGTFELPAPPAAPEPAPALTPAQHLEDAIDRHAAYLQMQGEDLTWANRARKADRIAGWLIKNDLEATPANINRGAKELVETKVPSDETIPMIQDRVDWHNARVAQAAAPDLAKAAAQ